MAFEYSNHGIRVNSVSPGFVETPLIEDSLQNERFMKVIEKKTALKRVASPEEVSNAITFVSSHEASFITGIDILVDGGFMLT